MIYTVLYTIHTDIAVNKYIRKSGPYPVDMSWIRHVLILDDPMVDYSRENLRKPEVMAIAMVTVPKKAPSEMIQLPTSGLMWFLWLRFNFNVACNANFEG